MQLAARKPISAILLYPLVLVIALAAGGGGFGEDNSVPSPITDFSLSDDHVEPGESIGPSGAGQVDAGESMRHQSGVVNPNSFAVLTTIGSPRAGGRISPLSASVSHDSGSVSTFDNWDPPPGLLRRRGHIRYICEYRCEGLVVSVAAAPATGYLFTGWSGACSHSRTICQVRFKFSESVTAHFTKAPL